MIIERGNIKLVRLIQEYIELVREKRNLPAIQARMENREYITPQMQLAWFQKINNINNNYFLVITDSKFIGLIYGADIDWSKGITNNGGIFIWDDNYLESVEILQASLLLTDFGFYFGMTKNFIRVLKDNKQAIAFNKGLGYQLLSGQEDNYNQKYELTPDAYFNITGKVRQHFSLGSVIKLTVTANEYNTYIKIFKYNSLKGIFDKKKLIGSKYNKVISVQLTVI